MKKCPKTMSGDHYWEEEFDSVLDKKTLGMSTPPLKKAISTGRYFCEFCGIYKDN